MAYTGRCLEVWGHWTPVTGQDQGRRSYHTPAHHTGHQAPHHTTPHHTTPHWTPHTRDLGVYSPLLQLHFDTVGPNTFHFQEGNDKCKIYELPAEGELYGCHNVMEKVLKFLFMQVYILLWYMLVCGYTTVLFCVLGCSCVRKEEIGWWQPWQPWQPWHGTPSNTSHAAHHNLHPL